jgi:hypothetical protein
VSLLAACGAGEPAQPPAPAAAPETSPAGAAAPQAPGTPGWFTDITAATGVDFVHTTGATGELHLPEIMASGAALFDADGDGDLDLYLINGAPDLGRTPPAGGAAAGGPVPRNRLYRQEAGGRFTDVTNASGLGDPGYGMGVAVGDIDNDGDADVYVTNLGADRLFRNRGDGTFEDATAAAGIDVGGWSSSAAFFDADRDGFLDLYVARYVAYDPAVRCYDIAGRHDYCGPTPFEGLHDVLLHNRGDGTFRDVSATAGIAAVADAGLGVVVEDFDGDGWPDVYVANDADPNQLWIHRPDGTFRDEALVRGASVSFQGMAQAGMGVLAGDLDGDLDLDLFMTHLRDETNTLYRNEGELGFVDATAHSGLAASSMPWTGFGTAAFDAELDGDLDLVVVNGRVYRRDVLPEALPPPPWDAFAEPNLFYLGRGDGRFDPAPEEGRQLTVPVEVSRGLAVGDLDDDGDVDLVVAQGEAPVRIYRNDAPRAGHWLRIEAVDPRLRREALGAQIVVEAGGRRWLRTVQRGASYLSSSDPRVFFGLGAAAAVETIRVRWPDGLTEVFPGGPADRGLRLERGRGEGG